MDDQIADCVGADDGQKAARYVRARKPLHRWMMDKLGNEWCGNSGPPRDNRTLYVHDDGLYRVFATSNDGFEVGIGYPNEWQMFMSWRAARMFAWWVVKVWVTDWFGLRDYLWYRALFRSTSRTGRWEKPRKHPRSVWKSSHDAWWEAEGKTLERVHNDPADDPDDRGDNGRSEGG